MTELEPVAEMRENFESRIFLHGHRETVSESFEVIVKAAIAERDERIAALEAENERLKDRLTEVAHQREDVKWTALTNGINKMSAEARAEAAEALLKEAGPIIVNLVEIPCVRNAPHNDGLCRAARSLASKIGGGE